MDIMIFDFDDNFLKDNYLYGSVYQTICDMDVDNNIPGGSCVLVKSDNIDSLSTIVLGTRIDWQTNLGNLIKSFNIINQNKNKNFVLITYGSYISPPQQFIDNVPPNIIKWYTVNLEKDHEKMFAIPLGIAKPIWENGQIKSCIIDNRSEEKKNLLYINHNIRTDERTNRPGIRKAIYDKFKNEEGKWFTIKDFGKGGCSVYGHEEDLDINVTERGDRIYNDGEKKISNNQKDFIKEMSSHKFVISPPGMGWETMRTWEALYCKTIPIIQKCKANEVFEGLPVLYVNNYKDISENMLNSVFEEFTNKKWDLSKMFFPHWKEKILCQK